MSIHERTELLIGKEGLQKLAEKKVLIAGVGGVGSFAAEAIIRSGIGHVTLLDHDEVSESNRNRQLIALQSTLGQSKPQVMAERAADINPQITVIAKDQFISPDNIEALLTEDTYDYVLDCIDSIACKAAMVITCQNLNIPVISSMGAGGRLDPSKVQITRLEKTINCGLAREMRRRLRKQRASLKYPVVFSSEIPAKGTGHRPVDGDENAHPRNVNGTISYLPAMFGLHMAGYVVRGI